ncbi:MAG: BamA/TamA family outer membrane protein, partial [Bacillota bacterium]
MKNNFQQIIISLVLAVIINLITTPAIEADKTTKMNNSGISVIDNIKELYTIKKDTESKHLPFIYYINEAGVMVGDFYYNTDLFDNQTKMISASMYAPSSQTFTSFTQIRDYPLSNKLSLGGDLKIIKYNDIKNGAIGNDSADEKISEEYFGALEEWGKLKKSQDTIKVNSTKMSTAEAIYKVATDQAENEEDIRDALSSEEEEILNTLEQDRDKLDGYRNYEGWNNHIAINLTYELDEHNDLIAEYAYEELTSQASDYKSDTLSLAWRNQNLDHKLDPQQGYKVITKVKKSLNLLGHDGDNDWDYTKLTFDARRYIPVFDDATLAVRMRTQSTTGDQRKDGERSALEKFRTGDIRANVYTYAPFFDMSLLGDLNTMRGYRYYRFYDNNSVLYQTELRFPLDSLMTRLQGVVFAEAGRVSDNFNTELFTEDLHYSGG